jgi:hypothetical protein
MQTPVEVLNEQRAALKDYQAKLDDLRRHL